MSDIKSAAEIAKEKVKGIGEATEEERLSWKYVPEGERLAAKYIKEGTSLTAELGHFDNKAKKYVAQGIVEVLVRNINLPKDEIAEKTNKRVMEGLKSVKTDKVKVENIYSGLRRIFSHYLEQGKQQKKQSYESLKSEFQAKVQQALQQQYGNMAGVRVDVEKQSQFQEEWRRLQARLDASYVKILDDYKRELIAIP